MEQRNGNGRARMLAYPGSACLPAFRMREDSPHFRRLARVAWRLMEAEAEIGKRTVNAFSPAMERMGGIEFSSGFGFDLTDTATLLLRAVEMMDGKASYFTSRIGGGIETKLFVSFRRLLEHMRRDPAAGEFGAASRLGGEGILIRTRRIAVAAVPRSGGVYREQMGTYTLDCGIGIGKVLMLNNSPETVREIIRLEALSSGEEPKKEGKSIMHRWRRELRMASYDYF